MNRGVLTLILLLMTVPFLMGDMVILKNNKQYKGIIFSEEEDPIVKIMQENGEPVYINREHIKQMSTEATPNRESKIENARLRDQLRTKERQFNQLREAYDQLAKQYEALRAEHEKLKSGAPQEWVPTEPTTFLRVLKHEVKYSLDSITVSGILQNEGDRDTMQADIMLYLYDEDGKLLNSLRMNALKSGKTLAGGQMMEFEVSENVGRDLISKLTSTKVTAVNEDDQ